MELYENPTLLISLIILIILSTVLLFIGTVHYIIILVSLSTVLLLIGMVNFIMYFNFWRTHDETEEKKEEGKEQGKLEEEVESNTCVIEQIVNDDMICSEISKELSNKIDNDISKANNNVEDEVEVTMDMYKPEHDGLDEVMHTSLLSVVKDLSTADISAPEIRSITIKMDKQIEFTPLKSVHIENRKMLDHVLNVESDSEYISESYAYELPPAMIQKRNISDVSEFDDCEKHALKSIRGADQYLNQEISDMKDHHDIPTSELELSTDNLIAINGNYGTLKDRLQLFFENGNEFINRHSC